MANYKAALAALLTIFLFSALAVYSISFVLPKFIAKFGGLASFAIPLSWIGGAIGGLLMGIFGDAKGRRLSLLISILLFVFPLIGNIIVNNIVVFYIIWFLIGFGVNAVNGISYVYAAELSPPNVRGLVGSIMQGLYFLGAIMGSLISFAARESISLYYVTIFSLSAISIPLWFLIPESKWRAKFSFKVSRDLAKATVFGSLFSIGAFLLLVPLVSLGFTLFTALGLNAYAVILAGFIIGMIGFTAAGSISDRIGRKRASYVFAGISVLASLLFLFGVNNPNLVATSFILLMFGSSFFAYFGVWMSEVYPANFKATGTNITLFLGRLLGGGFGVTLALLLPFGLERDLSLTALISSTIVLLSATQLPETVRAK
ncbi:MFS transporter [Thermoproteus tenax]|uniref:Permease of the major facilitator superfamily n=1 Tax=Thermoproteus tenax (strain ATCC 35583 / DSM 2078 / JCM 9277 / NBRC 100435 / Kra 1) TaxID=768679 RepID=G4RK06_THETK|nr:MFS transporter [Thermoproteus tenax]CCC81901.1 permease of the major facilitator superfamily [Thermoproteus tenax Kra 1]